MKSIWWRTVTVTDTNKHDTDTDVVLRTVCTHVMVWRQVGAAKLAPCYGMLETVEFKIIIIM